MAAPAEHSVRRREVARAAVHSIADGGLDGAALRSVALKGGWSVGVVQHYYRNKSELLAAAVNYLAERSRLVLEEHAASSTELERLYRGLKQIVPEGGSGEAKYWRVWVCFWAQATNDPSLAEAVEEQARLWRECLAAIIRAGQADGSIRRGLSPEHEAAYLAAAVDGLGITAAVDPGVPRLTRAVDRLIASISTSPDAGTCRFVGID